MGLKFNGDITVADLVSFGTAGVVGLFVIFDHGADIEALQVAQVNIEKEVHRVEAQAKEKDAEILQEVKSIKTDQKENFDKLDGKLDRLIERELNRNNRR